MLHVSQLAKRRVTEVYFCLISMQHAVNRKEWHDIVSTLHEPYYLSYQTLHFADHPSSSARALSRGPEVAALQEELEPVPTAALGADGQGSKSGAETQPGERSVNIHTGIIPAVMFPMLQEARVGSSVQWVFFFINTNETARHSNFSESGCNVCKD